MKVVQICNYVAPAKDSMGTQRVVEALSSGLRELGHHIYYFIDPSSDIDGEIVNKIPADADIVHFHGDFPEDFGYASDDFPWINTCHGGGHEPVDVFSGIGDSKDHIVAISKFVMNRLSLPDYAYNCINEDDFIFRKDKSDYFLWLAGTDWGEQKGLFSSIELANKYNFKLKIAGTGKDKKIIEKVRSLCSANVEYVGAINGEQKAELLADARAVLNIGRIQDAFCLVSVEAMISGTPVIARDVGAHPEIILDKKTGIICRSEPEILRAILSVNKMIDPFECQKYSLENFSKKIVAKSYLKIYEKMIEYNTLRRR